MDGSRSRNGTKKNGVQRIAAFGVVFRQILEAEEITQPG